VLFWAVRILLNWFVYHNDIWVITNQRLIDSYKRTPFNHTLSTADLVNLQDMTVHRRGILQTTLNYGDVVCETAGANGREFVLTGVPHPQEVQLVTRVEGDSQARYGQNLLPLGLLPETRTSPVFSYPYARSRDALAALAKNGAPDPCHGWKMRYANPLTGGFAMPTIGAFLQLLPAGFSSAAYRSTDATVYCVAEGTGRAQVGGETFEFEPKDTFVVPSWHPLRLEAHGECVLFSYSDRPAQVALGIWREQRG